MSAADLPASAASSGRPPSGPLLRDIHLPAEPSWWPPAPGWWILAALLVLLALAAVWLARRRRRRRLLLARVLGEVDLALAKHAVAPDLNRLAGELHQLLRRAARRLDPDAATRRGAAWRETLASVAVDAATLERLLALETWMYRAPSSASSAPAMPASSTTARMSMDSSAAASAATSPAANSAGQKTAQALDGTSTVSVVTDSIGQEAVQASVASSTAQSGFDVEATAAAVRRWLSLAWRRAPQLAQRVEVADADT